MVQMGKNLRQFNSFIIMIAYVHFSTILFEEQQSKSLKFKQLEPYSKLQQKIVQLSYKFRLSSININLYNNPKTKIQKNLLIKQLGQEIEQLNTIILTFQFLSKNWKFKNCLSCFYQQIYMSKKYSSKINEAIPWHILIKTNEVKFLQKLNTLRRLVKIWHDDQDEKYQKEFSLKNVLIQYAKYINEINEGDHQKSIFSYRSISYDQELKTVINEKEIYLGFNFIDQKLWKLNFSRIFIKQLSKLSQEQVKHIFMLMFIYTQGFLPLNGTIQFGFKLVRKISDFHQSLYIVPIFIDGEFLQNYLLVNFFVQKLIVGGFKNNSESSFEYNYCIQCQRIQSSLTISENKRLQKLIDHIKFLNQNNPKLSYGQQQLVIEQKNLNQKLNYIGIKIHSDQGNNVGITFPLPYKAVKANKYQMENYQFQIKKYQFHQNKDAFLDLHQINNTNSINYNKNWQSQNYKLQEQISQNKNISFKETTQVLNILRKIPNFKYQLTNQQRQTLSQDGNLIVVGRSGTGKTTCAMLRLFGIQHMTKIKQINMILSDPSINNNKCKLVMFEELQLDKNMFLTFSPILIEEIKKQYNDMIFQIKQHHSIKCESCKATFQKKKTFNNEQDPIDKLNRLLREQQKEVISLSNINHKNFPAFYTIQNFLRMIDKTINRPFFDHELQKERKNNLIGIKQAYINKYNYFDQNIEFIETIEAVYVDYDFFYQHIWRQMPKNLTNASNQFNLLTPSVVWSEILSIIKGSVHSYTCPQGFISLKMYLKEKRNVFQNYEEEEIIQIKLKVYSVFQIYQNWCQKENGYDLMDVVNHLLQETQFFGYNGPKMNYMFIDEVQDLTSASIFLLSKMVINNVFYCGDTAQAITKGIDFRFEDIKYIFNKQFCRNPIDLEPPSQPINLTVNFRSHNCILQLANSIISSIQQIFPKSINKMRNRKEKSDLVGPKPNIILNRIDLLLQLICGPNNLTEAENNKETRKFNCEQIIIVRNQQEKLKLPQNLQEGLVLTPQTAKGLQYDQIILYNFFTSCKCFQKWKILDYLDIETQYQDPQQFQNQLNKRKQQETNQKDESQRSVLSLDQKILLGYSKLQKQYVVKTIKKKPTLKEVSLNSFFEIATQLKLLYTIITRSRSVFVIYDEKIPLSFTRILQKMDLVVNINDNNVKAYRKEIQGYTNRERHIKYLNEAQLWIAQGQKMLFRRQFEQAKTCYRRANKLDIVERIQAMQIEIKTDNEMYRIQNEYKKIELLDKIQRKIHKIKLEKQKSQIIILYNKAGQILLKYNRFSEAAKLFYKGQDFNQALYCFKAINDQKNIADCYMKLHQYEEASQYYQKNGDLKKLIKCYILAKNWKKLYVFFRSSEDIIGKTIEKQNIQQSIYNLLHHSIENDQIQKQKQKYQIFIKKEKKITLNLKEFDQQLNKILTEDNYWKIKNIYDELIIKKQKIQLINAKIILQQSQYLSSLEQKQIQKNERNQIKKQIDQINQKLQSIKQQKQKLVCNNTQNLEKQQMFSHLNLQKKQLSQLKRQHKQKLKSNQRDLQKTENQISQCKQQLQKLKNQNSEILVYSNKKNINQSLKEVVNQLKLIINNKIKQSSVLQKNNKQKFYKFNRNLQTHSYDDSIDDDMMSVSDISQIDSFWQVQQSNIIGIKLNSYTKQSILSQISQIIQLFYRKMISDEIQSFQYRENMFHYKHLQSKIKYVLKQKALSNQIKLLQRCSAAKQINCCLLICDINPELVSLSPKYILMYILDFSDNYKFLRHYKCQQISSKQQIKIAINKVNNLVSSLSNQLLNHKIPRLSLDNKFYNQSIIRELAIGLILQGFYKQVFMFCNSSANCKLAYLFSDYQGMVKQIKNTAKILHNLNIPDKKYIFLTDQIIFRHIPESKALNIFSTQNIFYAYDQCQIDPFLSKKLTVDQVDIDEETVGKILNERVSIKRIQLKQKKDNLNAENKLLKKQIEFYKKCDKQKNKYNQNFYGLNQFIIQQMYQQLTTKCRQLQNLKKQFQQNQSDKNTFVFNLNKYKISKGTKLKKEQEIQTFRKNIQIEKQNNKIDKVQKLQKLREEAVKQYSIQRENQKKSNDQYTKNQQKMKQLKYSISRKLNQIKKYESEIKDKKIQLSHSAFNQENIQIHLEFMKKQIAANTESMPKELNANDERLITKAIEQTLIKQQKQSLYQNNRSQLIQKAKQQIKKSSNIPPNYKFLKYYLDDQMSMKNRNKEVIIQKIVLQYQSILNEGLSIQIYENVNNENGSQAICRIIMFYLSFMFNQSFRDDVLKTLINYKMATDNNFRKVQQYKIFMKQQLFSQKQRLQIVKSQREKCKANKMVNFYMNIKQFDDRIQEIQKNINQIQYKLNRYKIIIESPQYQIHKFLQNIYKRIKNINSQNFRFMQILFGFFQCRIIQDYPLLDFLANQYVLVRSNSIVIEKIKNDNNFDFCFYFDQEKTTVLCCFQDIQNVILNLLEKQHLNLYKKNQQMSDFQIKNIDKKKFIDTQMIGYTKKKKDENGLQYNLMVCKEKVQRDKIIRLYDGYFKYNQFQKQIKPMKRQLLKIFFQNKFTQKDSYFFIIHQLRQLNFIEQLYVKANSFNPDLLEQMRIKLTGLQQEFKKWKNANDKIAQDKQK